MEKARFYYTREFDTKYAYDGHDLGAVCRKDSTCFKLWAPFADRVELLFFERGGAEPAACHAMERGEKGVWALSFDASLHGTFYEYRLWTDGEAVDTCDPYAVSCGRNSHHSMVVDLSLTNPDGFETEASPAKPTESIIYELHIKDFSFDENSGIPEEYRGKFKAFTVDPKSDYPTCIPYLKALGVTHVHLLPFYDYGWLDEAAVEDQYNWGYDPVNYNVPEGSYATNSEDGVTRIRECKEMIQALHRAGLRVIMDVVYNHTYEADSWLGRSAPGYYYREESDGTLSDGSACGNDIAAGRAMVDHYIADSVMYWAKEYHLDGFRFDLMGLLTTDLMNRIREELDEAFGEGEILVYGEPWQAAPSPMEEGTYPAVKDQISRLHKGVAVFSDDTRDLIKGDVFHPDWPGFVNGGKGMEVRVLQAVKGWRTNGNGFSPKNCGQVLHYVSAHDNYTLWDKLLFTLKDGGETPEESFYLTPYESVLTINRLTALIYFCCQGNLFLQAGEEFGRSKLGDENSYRSDSRINMLRWEQTQTFARLVSYYKGLIALRKQLPGLYDKSEEAHKRIFRESICAEQVVSFCVDNRDASGSSEWDTLLVVFNASEKPYTMIKPQGTWQVLADACEADCRKNMNDTIVVPAHSGLIAGRVKEEL